MRKIFIIILLFAFSSLTYASIDVCFTPGENCEQQIISAIAKAQKQILVQAYSFTNHVIAKALIDAEHRGVDVRVLLDKSQLKGKSSVLSYLSRQNIETKIDYKPAIAHNKIMIIDNSIVITGSYNFTVSAEKRNAENLLIIEDKELAGKYKNNWINRGKVSG